ncbi:hypothetical protein ACFFQW_12730 [Umezawaea endophytica]|uniref:Uncharacterized protein n=1 Tax=Umezawaea endophytica TaxID=1654476 RepID=A0A9X2VIH0_9PSEU|nr:hypothetical protein [Umezawaea endophytica]MCS7477228.1 hypothetical protein [Umezawaea endophytica]
MTIRQFLVHADASGSRLFAVDHGEVDRLDVVAEWGPGEVARADDVVRVLDLYLALRDEGGLEDGLRGLPDVVLRSIREFLRSRCAPEPGAFGPGGFIVPVRRARFRLEAATIDEYLSGAYAVGLGIRVENGVDERHGPHWDVVLLNRMPFVPADGGARAWALPDGSRVESEWVVGEAPGRQVPVALDSARRAVARDKRVRIHTYLQGDGEHWLDGAMTTSVVVDVFDEPAPA